ncbi:prolyl oligopeptidase family serine peptidase [Candidatus Hydrogenedentota bacterium]
MKTGDIPYPDTHFGTVEVDGDQFSYRLFLPSTYDDTKPFPLIMGLHGGGGDETSYFEWKGNPDRIQTFAEDRGYIVVCPAAPRKRKELSVEVPLEVVRRIRKQRNIDPDRIYITGFSMGGFTTYLVVAREPEVFAAAFGIVWPPVTDTDAIYPLMQRLEPVPAEKKIEGLAKVPLQVFIGTRDRHTPIDIVEGDVQRIREAGGEVELHVHEGGHGGYRLDWVYEKIFDWFDAHVKTPEEASDDPVELHEN